MSPMDVRSVSQTKPITLHETVTVHSMVPKFEKHEETAGTYLEFFDVFEVQIEDEARRLIPGDLVHIPPNARHSAWTDGEERVRVVAFACSYQEPEGLGYVPCELPQVQPER